MSIEIRRIRATDGPALEELYASEAVVAQTAQQPGRDAKFWTAFYTTRDPNAVELVAVVEDRVVGHLGILTSTNPRLKHTANLGIAVHEAFQGRGVGKALLAEAVHICDTWLNIVRFDLSVFADNVRAIALYERFGFEREGVIRKSVFRDGVLVDGLLMARIHPAHRD